MECLSKTNAPTLPMPVSGKVHCELLSKAVNIVFFLVGYRIPDTGIFGTVIIQNMYYLLKTAIQMHWRFRVMIILFNLNLNGLEMYLTPMYIIWNLTN